MTVSCPSECGLPPIPENFLGKTLDPKTLALGVYSSGEPYDFPNWRQIVPTPKEFDYLVLRGSMPKFLESVGNKCYSEISIDRHSGEFLISADQKTYRTLTTFDVQYLKLAYQLGDTATILLHKELGPSIFYWNIQFEGVKHLPTEYSEKHRVNFMLIMPRRRENFSTLSPVIGYFPTASMQESEAAS